MGLRVRELSLYCECRESWKSTDGVGGTKGTDGLYKILSRKQCRDQGAAWSHMLQKEGTMGRSVGKAWRCHLRGHVYRFLLKRLIS